MGTNVNAINLFMTGGNMVMIYSSYPQNHDISLGTSQNVDDSFLLLFTIINHDICMYLSKLK